MLEWLGNKYVEYRIPSLDKLRNDALRLQQNQFASLIGKGRDSQFAQQYFPKGLADYKAFAQAVPLFDYEQTKPFIHRMMMGEKNVLCSDEIKWFSKSSGTTDVSKFIPVSRAAMQQGHFKAGRDILAAYFERYPNNKLFSGKHLVMGGSIATFTENPSVMTGDVSAVLMKNITPWIQVLRTPTLDIALMNNWEEKLEEMAQHVATQNVTGISGVPTWTLLLLKRVLEITGKESIADVWQNFEMFIHGGVNFQPFKKSFDEIFGKSVVYINAYNASEGFFAMQDTDEESMLLLPDHGIFYEFIPAEESKSKQPIVLPLQELQCNKTYELVITTNSGLWRYRVGDTVRFVSLNPYRIIVAGRTKQFINIMGEELMVHNAEKAIAEVCAKHNCTIKDFTVAPIFPSADGTAAHEWLIEFERPPGGIVAFKEDLDQQLQLSNSDYAAKRSSNLALRELEVTVLPQNTFHQWLSSKGKLGGQHKVPRMSSERKLAEELMSV
jgi:hypothetical protein